MYATIAFSLLCIDNTRPRPQVTVSAYLSEHRALHGLCTADISARCADDAILMEDERNEGSTPLGDKRGPPTAME